MAFSPTRRALLVAVGLLVGCGGRSSLLSPSGDGRVLDPDRGRPDRGPLSPGWIAIPAGSYAMGSPVGEACREQGNVRETQHTVSLGRGFAMEETEVTQEAYRQVAGYSPASHASCGSTCPVEQVTWHEAAAYCNALSARNGLAACYQCSGSGADVSCTPASGHEGAKIYACDGYRLPTEAEWEYAYRAGTTTAFWNGPVSSCETDPVADAIGWYEANASGMTHPVRQKQANPWGLHDLPGNVWEWCHDGYLQDLGSAAVTDPVSSLLSSSRAIRGSSYIDKAGNLRASDRFGMPPGIRNINVGFRCVRGL
jgi:formylglycine-generating enzyme required for sulfatase activity